MFTSKDHLSWREILPTIAMLVALLAYAPHAQAQDAHGVDALFTQQDTVQAFDVVTGKGFQIGTAVGWISGTTFVDFSFEPTGAPIGDVLPIAFHNKVLITDLDGDQVSFENDGTGSFHLGVPGFPFQGTGGPLRGTYVVTGATGKFTKLKVGTTFVYRAIATNPPSPGQLGTVLAQVSRGKDERP